MRLGSCSRPSLWLIPAGLVAASVSASAASRSMDTVASSAGERLPQMIAVDGRPISDKQLRGRVTLINFWASWCAPCQKELPSLERLAAKRHDLTVIAASVDADRKAGIRAFDRRYSHLRLSFASLDAVQQLGALGMPYSVILNRDGRVAARVGRAIDWDGREGASLLARAH